MNYKVYSATNNYEGLKITALCIMAVVITYCLIGAVDSCPACGKWFARQTYNKEYQYKNEVECHDSVAHHIYDSKGNIISTWYTYDDYIRVDEHFKYFHSCLKCNAKWSTIGTESHRRRW